MMSDYYQQQVTVYMMRRAKRRAAEESTVSAGAPAGAGSVKGGLVARLGTLLPRQQTRPSVAQPVPRPTGEIEAA